MDIIEEGFHVELSIVNKYFFFSIMIYLINALLCDENNRFLGIQLCYKDTYYVLGFSYYSKLYSILSL
jgi:hypothetical protein